MIHHGDCFEVLRTLPDCSVDAVVTDPPYGLSFMGKRWDYDVPSVEVWAECLRVLKPGGHLLAFAGTRTQHRMAVRIEDAGFEIRDMIAWVYGSGFPKSHNLKDDWQGWGTALKPALEPITVARKPLIGTVAENVLAHGTGALNVDGCRVESDGAHKRPFQPSNYERTVYGARAQSGFQPTNAEGRWPANLIHDGSDEVVGLFPQSGNGGGPRVGIRGGHTFSGDKGKNDTLVGHWHGDSGSAARFFYCAKASKADRDEGCEGLAAKEAGIKNDSGRGFSESDPMAKIMRRNHHPTVKPTALMQYLCRLVTPPGGTVLDPFMGSGSTGAAAMLEGFQFIGIEREAEYVAIARERIESRKDLFSV